MTPTKSPRWFSLVAVGVLIAACGGSTEQPPPAGGGGEGQAGAGQGGGGQAGAGQAGGGQAGAGQGGGGQAGAGQGGQGGACSAMDAKGVGACDMMLGWAWAGDRCVGLSGCSCAGGDCASLYASFEACLKARVDCGAYDPCAGKSCGQTCSPCPANDPECVAPAVVHACNEVGACVPGNPLCGGECNEASDCPAIKMPCELCWDGSTACPGVDCVGGKCVYELPVCPPPPGCAPQQAKGVGDCKMLLGFAWDGAGCVSLDGCECQGPDCGKIFPSLEGCHKAYAACPSPDPCAGKLCGDPCWYCPPGQDCDLAMMYCNQLGQCTTAMPQCKPPVCTKDSDCPLPPDAPCKVCPDGSQACTDADCIQGQCVYSAGKCPCDAMDAHSGSPFCPAFYGYAWDGAGCVGIAGCECQGSDCDQLYPSLDDCHKAHTVCPCAGKPCGDPCWYCPPGQACPEVVMHCNQAGQCQIEPPVCEPQCKVNSDCPPLPVGMPCEMCADGSARCPVSECVEGVCTLEISACLCDPQDAHGEGPCEAFFGYAWDGAGCVGLGGCSCKGLDCNELYPGPDECKKAHAKCALISGACEGKSCGDPCSTCPAGQSCPPVAETCDAKGHCSPYLPACPPPPPSCTNDGDCLAPAGPCLACPDGSFACPEGECVKGSCTVHKGSCLCDPEDASGVGPCDASFGVRWDGGACVDVSGCECQGVDCDELAQTKDACLKAHASCVN